MIVEAQKVENGLFIPMTDQFKKIKQGKILVEIEVIEQNQKDLERKQREGYLLKPVEPGEFSDWEDEQVCIGKPFLQQFELAKRLLTF